MISGSRYDGSLFSLHIEGWIRGIDILLIQSFPQLLDAFAESLEVDDLPLTKEFDHIVYIGIV